MVCHQLGIISYHQDVEDITPQSNKQLVVHSVRVKLVQAVQLPPRCDVKVSVQLEGNSALCGPVLIESNSEYLSDRICFTESLITTPEQKQTEIVLTNPTGIAQQLEAGVNLGHSIEVEVVPYASLTFAMDDTGEIAQGVGNNKDADYATSVLTVKTLDVDG